MRFRIDRDAEPILPTDRTSPSPLSTFRNPNCHVPTRCIDTSFCICIHCLPAHDAFTFSAFAFLRSFSGKGPHFLACISSYGLSFLASFWFTLLFPHGVYLRKFTNRFTFTMGRRSTFLDDNKTPSQYIFPIYSILKYTATRRTIYKPIELFSSRIASSNTATFSCRLLDDETIRKTYYTHTFWLWTRRVYIFGFAVQGHLGRKGAWDRSNGTTTEAAPRYRDKLIRGMPSSTYASSHCDLGFT